MKPQQAHSRHHLSNPLNAKKRKMFNARWFWGGFSVTVLFSVLVMGSVIGYQFNLKQAKFDKRVHLASEQIERQSQKIDSILNSIVSMYQTETMRDDYQFHVFYHTAISQLSTVKMLGIAQSESLDNMSKLRGRMYTRGYESFRLKCDQIFQGETCSAMSKNLSKAGEAVVLPVVQLEPFSPQTAVFLGYNLMSLPGIKPILLKSITHQHSQMIFLTGQAGKMLAGEHFLLIFKPYFAPSFVPLTVEQRRQSFRGVAFVLLNLATEVNSLQSFFKDIGRVNVDIEPYQNAEFKHALPKLKKTVFQLHGHFTNKPYNIQLHYNFRKPLGLHDIHFWPVIWVLLASWFVLAILTGLFYQLRQHSAQLATQKRRMEKIFETSHDVMIVLSETGHILEWNPGAESVFGHPADAAKGQKLFDMLSPSEKTSSKDILDWLGIELVNGSKNHRQIKIFSRHKQHMILDMACSVINIKNGFEISLFMRDQTEQHQTQEKVKQLAYSDALTQLKNRFRFEQVMRNRVDAGVRFSVLFFDLDGFKQINDALGHSVGDELLKVLGQRLMGWRKKHPKVTALSRFGGDEFVILVEEIDRPALCQLANGVLALVANRVQVRHSEMQISASLGIASFPEDGDSINTLLKRADMAMYDAKAMGANRFSFYDSRLEAVLTREIQIQRNLRNALRNHEFHLVYQPKINLQTGNIESVEALLRWQNAEMGVVGPNEFIPVAEKTHLISLIGDWVIKEVLRQMVEWQHTLPTLQNVAINVSSVQLQHPRFVEKMIRWLNKTGLSPHMIELELTERIIMSNTHLHQQRMKEIRNADLSLSVDDFGTGYSSLSYLKHLPLNTLKIDKSFVDGLPQDKDDVAIATAIIQMAHSLGLKVVAEGVENEEQLQFLKSLGCDSIQGYFTGKPMLVADLEQAAKQRIKL